MSTGDPTRPPSDPRLRERAGFPRWQPRRKRALRRFRNDLRNALPMLGIVLCFGLSAGAIFATEWLPAERDTTPPAVSAAGPERSECEPRSAEIRASATLRPVATLAETSEFESESRSTRGLREARPRR